MKASESNPLGTCVCCNWQVDSFDERWEDADVCHKCSDDMTALESERADKKEDAPCAG